MKDNEYMDSADTYKEQELILSYDHSQDKRHWLCGISVTLDQKCMYVQFSFFFFLRFWINNSGNNSGKFWLIVSE